MPGLSRGNHGCGRTVTIPKLYSRVCTLSRRALLHSPVRLAERECRFPIPSFFHLDRSPTTRQNRSSRLAAEAGKPATDGTFPSFSPRSWCSEGFVNKTDDYADDRPLDEVSHSLSQSEFQPDVQVHVVVQHKCANYENANENAEARSFRSARSARMYHYHCENYRDNQDRPRQPTSRKAREVGHPQLVDVRQNLAQTGATRRCQGLKAVRFQNTN